MQLDGHTDSVAGEAMSSHWCKEEIIESNGAIVVIVCGVCSGMELSPDGKFLLTNSID